jgi:hypothetical protein
MQLEAVGFSFLSRAGRGSGGGTLTTLHEIRVSDSLLFLIILDILLNYCLRVDAHTGKKTYTNISSSDAIDYI